MFYHSTGWLSQRTEHAEVHLPTAPLQKLEPFDELSADDLPYIHEQVSIVSSIDGSEILVILASGIYSTC